MTAPRKKTAPAEPAAAPRKKAATATAAAATADPTAPPVADQTPTDPSIDSNPVPEVEITPVPVVVVPVEDCDYCAEVDFTASHDSQLLSFKAGEKLDPLAGAALHAAGAPITVQPRTES